MIPSLTSVTSRTATTMPMSLSWKPEYDSSSCVRTALSVSSPNLFGSTLTWSVTSTS